MDNRNKETCKFCLKIIYDNNFDIIGEVARQMLDALLLKLNLSREESVMCLECATKLQNAVDFKTACLNAETKISSEAKGELVAREVNCKKNTNGVSEDQKVCRFCMNKVESGSCTDLQERKEYIFLLDMIQKYIPELCLNVAQEVVTCETCHASLQNLLSFITDCLQNEENVKEGMDTTEVKDELELNQDFTMIYKASGSAAVVEKNCDSNADVIVKDEIEEEDPLKIDNVDMDIKHEEMEIKSEENDSESDDDVQVSGTPPVLVAAAKNVTINLLPNKSKEKYEFAYKRFMDYCHEKIMTSRSENVMIAYFSDLSTKLKASTLWSNYSMLRATLSTKEDIDISKYSKLRAFLKRQSDNYKPKTSRVLLNKQLETFITQAPDHKYLMNKVALIFGVTGACRRSELYQLNLNDIEDLGSKLLIKILGNKMKQPRSFVINETYMPLYRKYVACRPKNFESCRFFFKYSNGKGCRQVVGVHQFGRIPQIVAKFLNLPNADEYTGHCFRRSSATISDNAEAGLISL